MIYFWLIILLCFHVCSFHLLVISSRLFFSLVGVYIVFENMCLRIPSWQDQDDEDISYVYSCIGKIRMRVRNATFAP